MTELRIVLCSSSSPWSDNPRAKELSLHNLACALSSRGHQVDVIYAKSHWAKPTVPQTPYRVHWAGALTQRGNLGAHLVGSALKGTLEQILAGPPIHIVHGTGLESAALPSLFAKSNAKLVMSYWGLASRRSLLERSFVWNKLRASTFWGFRSALQQAAYWCPVSQTAAHDATQIFKIPVQNCRIIPNGSGPVFDNARRDASPPVKNRAIFFGRLSADNGLETLLAALHQLGPQAPDLDVIGGGPEKTRTKRRANALGLRVRFFHRLSAHDLVARLSDARLAVLPIVETNLRSTVIDAMATGIPVLTTNVNSIPELIEHGHTGLMVPPNDSSTLAHEIRRLLEDRTFAETLGGNGQRWVRAHLSWDRAAKEYEAVYESALLQD